MSIYSAYWQWEYKLKRELKFVPVSRVSTILLLFLFYAKKLWTVMYQKTTKWESILRKECNQWIFRMNSSNKCRASGFTDPMNRLLLLNIILDLAVSQRVAWLVHCFHTISPCAIVLYKTWHGKIPFDISALFSPLFYIFQIHK